MFQVLFCISIICLVAGLLSMIIGMIPGLDRPLGTLCVAELGLLLFIIGLFLVGPGILFTASERNYLGPLLAWGIAIKLCFDLRRMRSDRRRCERR